MRLINGMVLVFIGLMLQACGEDSKDSSAEVERDISENSNLYAGWWLPMNSNGIVDESVNTFVGESGMTIIRFNDALYFGDLQYSQSEGSGTLSRMQDGQLSTYTATVTVSSEQMNVSLISSDSSLSIRYIQDELNNSSYQRTQRVSDLSGEWFYYSSGSSETLSLDFGHLEFHSPDLNCQISINIQDNNHIYSEFSVTANMFNCVDFSKNGGYQGVVVSGSKQGNDSLIVFLHNLKNWVYFELIKA